ncbi:MAG: MFS transporter, partial [Beijerinckiaceae bacterium]
MHFVAFFFCGFASAIANRTTDPLTVEIATDLGVPVSSVALLASVLAFMYAAGQPVIGPAGDHFGKARILKIAMWVAGLSVLASAFAPNFQVLMALRPITGLASGGIVP